MTKNIIYQNHGGRMSDSQTTLEALITEAIDRFPGHDFILKHHHRDGIWTVAFGNNIEAFVAIGYGKKPREALEATVPVTPRALKRLKTCGHQPN
jgi:hypothetical protein